MRQADPGPLAPGPAPDFTERTYLAWARSCSSVVVAGVLIGRIAYESLGVLGLAVATLGAALGVWVLVDARRLYKRRTVRVLPGAKGAASTLALAVLLMGVVALMLVLGRP